MHWFDYAAILLALLLALMADMDGRAAMRASVAVYLRVESGWVRTYELRRIFGPFVYKVLRELVVAGTVERKTAPGNPHLRGGYPDALYRWKPVKEPDA